MKGRLTTEDDFRELKTHRGREVHRIHPPPLPPAERPSASEEGAAREVTSPTGVPRQLPAAEVHTCSRVPS